MTLGKAHGEKPECARPAVRASVVKAESVTQISSDEKRYASDWTEPELPLEELGEMVRNSNILPQCIRAYKNNIAGYGIGIKYIKDDQEETEEAEAEWERLQDIVNLLSIEQDTKQVFEDIIEAREKYGVAFCEVIRDLQGNVVQLDFIKDTASMRKSKPLLPYQDMGYFYRGRVVRRKKKFRKYKQEIGGSAVYFKEFGDPRIMDLRDGTYKDGIERQYQANEIIDFPVGSGNYGEVRWIGQILGSDGSRRAEYLNNNYFVNGRHIPLLIAIKGGTLTDESYTKLQEYMDGIRGAAGQHSFLILETESIESNFDVKQPEIELKDLAGVLQKDELFQEYIENNRKRVQSAFNLPDLYVGYTKDFNRATAQTAMEITEKQVFQPERASLAWVINHRLLNGYQLRYCEVEFKAPEITNPDDLYKILTVAEKAGGLPPNKAKQVAYQALGESSDDYPGEWGEVPIAVSAQNAGQQLDGQIEKAEQNGEPGEMVAVMKEVRRLLHDIGKQGDSDGKSYLKS
ncbi:MAG: phage portal protein [Lachnospiraceae bacterium]|nr:phage portal protein [Lachnospiraceae bacterium]